ncbi:hypothetical protein M9H77_12723 [Catharanthus roseus]|uniref:Uncharacterized protein n=1 Tax=Catharanthus roseus TaxID=4058 RepID=A0ACC0BIB7_CATRO|nr:hypothetical protein M9H77_12723 [Catharanthus roseus]
MNKRGVKLLRRDMTRVLPSSTFQDKRKIIGGKHHHNHKETSISFSSNSLPLSIEFSFKELKMNDYYSNVANVDSFVFEVENKEERMLDDPSNIISNLLKENDNGVVAYMEEALKDKLEGFEGQEKASKAFSMCSIRTDHSRERIRGENG